MVYVQIATEGKRNQGKGGWPRRRRVGAQANVIPPKGTKVLWDFREVIPTLPTVGLVPRGMVTWG